MPQLLAPEDIDAALSQLEGWSGDSSGISRTVELPGFPAAIKVVDQVAVVAEELDHHPDIDIRWNTLTFTNVTHSAGGLTENDIVLAGRINQIVAAAA